MEFESVDDVLVKDYEAVSPVPLDMVSRGDAFLLRPAALYGIHARGNKQFVKTHCARRTVNEIELIPSAVTRCAIYIVRDPRDVAISYAAHLGVSVDDAIERLRLPAYLDFPDNPLVQFASTWSDNVASWTGGLPFPVLVLKYEGMPGNFAKAIEFVGDELNQERLAKAIDATSFEKMQAQEAEKGFGEKPPTAERFFRVGRSTWREVLTKEQVARIEGDHGEMMEKLGYALAAGA